MSSEEFARITPVSPPTVNRKMKPRLHSVLAVNLMYEPYSVLTHLKILIPVGTAMIIVAVVKYARVSVSIPTVNMWWAQTTNPKIPIANMA